jgi:excisionase family DNA binding protein
MLGYAQQKHLLRIGVLLEEPPRIVIGDSVLTVEEFRCVVEQFSTVLQLLESMAQRPPSHRQAEIAQKDAQQTGEHGVVTAKEMARILKVRPATVYRLASERRIPVLRLGRLIRFDIALVTKALNRDLQA